MWRVRRPSALWCGRRGPAPTPPPPRHQHQAGPLSGRLAAPRRSLPPYPLHAEVTRRQNARKVMCIRSIKTSIPLPFGIVLAWPRGTGRMAPHVCTAVGVPEVFQLWPARRHAMPVIQTSSTATLTAPTHIHTFLACNLTFSSPLTTVVSTSFSYSLLWIYI